MTQLYTKVVVEFLPVYVPSEYEKYNPLIFAEGVRNVMAKYVKHMLSLNDFVRISLIIYLNIRVNYRQMIQFWGNFEYIL